MDTRKDGPLTLPVAIVVAGILIAGAIFISKSDGLGGSARPKDSASLNTWEDLFKSPEKTEPPASTASLDSIPPFSPEKDHILGNPNAQVVIVEYSDLECPFCRIFHQTLRRIMDEHGKQGTVAWVYRHFPLIQLHSKAPREAEATECAGELGGNAGFWKFTDRIFEVTPSNNRLEDSELFKIAEYVGLNADAFTACLDSKVHSAVVQNGYNEAAGAGANGTPFSILFLAKPLTPDVVKEFLPLFDPYRDPNTGRPPINISDDGTRLSLSGAMPYELINELLKILLK